MGWTGGCRLLGLIALCTSLIAPSLQQCLTKNDLQLGPNQATRANLYTGQQEFSLGLLEKINRLSRSENVFFSPYSIYHALLLAYFISSTDTEAALKQSLRLGLDQDKTSVLQAYKVDKFLVDMLSNNESGDYKFKSANKIYVSDKVGVRDCMLSLLPEEIEQVDFYTNPTRARNLINSWVEKQTYYLIKDLIPSLDQATDLVLANAAYFKGQWMSEFKPENTKKAVFFVSSRRQVMVDMMNQEAAFNFDTSEALGAHVLEMPYKGGDVSMFILLPPFAKDNSVEDVLAKLNADSLQKVLLGGGLYQRTVNVSLPKFKLEHTVQLQSVLQEYGVGNLFESSADLSLLTGSKNIHLNDAVHKAVIEVNEEGSEAAAASALFSFRSSRPLEPAVFRCDHPFVYIIYSKSSKSILFLGVYRMPQ